MSEEGKEMAEGFITKENGIKIKKRMKARVVGKVSSHLSPRVVRIRVSHGRVLTLKRKWQHPREMECLA